MKEKLLIIFTAFTIFLSSSSFGFCDDIAGTRKVLTMDEVKENERILSIDEKEIKKSFEFEVPGEPDYSSYTIENAGKGELKVVPKQVKNGFFSIKKITDIRSYLIGSTGGLTQEKEYKNLLSKKLPEGSDEIKDKNGNVFKLKNTEWEEIKRQAGTGTLTITGSDTEPEFPSEKLVKLVLKSGETIEVKAKLKEVKKIGESYSKKITLTGKYIGESDVSGYMLNGVLIPKSEKTPVYEGYEKTILKNLGVSSRNLKIVGSRWTSDYTFDETLGETVRYFEFNCLRPSGDYRGYYEETLDENSEGLVLYNAKCKYDNGEAKYKVHLVAVYGKTEILVGRVLIAAGVSLSILGIIIAIILYIIRRKRDAETNKTNAETFL